MPFLTAPDGVRLAYSQHGSDSGADVVLLAGFRAPGSSWRFQVPALVAAGYRVTVLDLRGHGAADPSPVGTTMATRASDVDVLLRHLGISDAVLVGGSMGASTIWAYVAEFGESRVRAVVSVDQTPRMLNGDGWDHGFYGYDAANRDTYFATTIPETGMGTPLWRKPVRTLRLLRAMAGVSRELGPGDLGLLNDHARADWRTVIASFSRPVLFVAGAESEYWPSSHAAAAAALAPRGSSAVVERAGHATNMEQWRAFNGGLRAASSLIDTQR